MVQPLSLYDLQAWKNARALRIEVSKLVKTFPKTERYRLNDQLLRSSRSVAANIAEGFGRFHFQESAQYYRQARGSITETSEHLICAFDEGYISKETLIQIQNLVKNSHMLINGLIRSQFKSKSNI